MSNLGVKEVQKWGFIAAIARNQTPIVIVRHTVMAVVHARSARKFVGITHDTVFIVRNAKHIRIVVLVMAVRVLRATKDTFLTKIMASCMGRQGSVVCVTKSILTARNVMKALKNA